MPVLAICVLSLGYSFLFVIHQILSQAFGLDKHKNRGILKHFEANFETLTESAYFFNPESDRDFYGSIIKGTCFQQFLCSFKF